MGMNTVNLGSDPYGVEESQLAERLRLAQLLMRQSQDTAQPIYSGKAALAKMLMGALGGHQQREAEKGQRELADRKDSARKSEMDAIFNAMQGSEPKPYPQPANDDEGNPMPPAAMAPGKGPDRMALARLLANSSNPQMAQAGLSLAMKGPEKPEAYTLKPGEQRFEGGKVVATVPHEPKLDGPKRGESRRIIRGGDEVQQEWTGVEWKDIGTGPRWQPQQPDRSLVEVVDPSNPQRTIMVPRDQAAGKAGAQTLAFGKAGREDMDGLRKEFATLPVVKNFTEVKPIIESARKAPDTPQGDLALVYAVGKVLDPGSVVREGEMDLVIKSGSPLERIVGAGRRTIGKGSLTPEMRAKLLQMLNGRASEYESAYNAARSTYEGIAKQRGYDPSQIFTNSPYLPAGGDGWGIRPLGGG